ncbi:MAG: M20 family metallopeptidase [Enterococcus sp.]
MKQFVKKEHQVAAVEALAELIRVPSVLDESDTGQGHPFGRAVVAALDKVVAICDGLGFQTFRDPEGYYAYAEVGQGSELFGILCHMDVVPAAEQKGWLSNPFEPEINEGVIIGRGTQDDKGPSMAALFAVKALIDAGVEFNQRIRFIFGSDEENLWRCLEKYNEKEEGITQGFAPDAEFPLIYAEKGLLQAYLVGPGSQELALNVNGALNVVPDTASYQGTALPQIKAHLDALDFEYELTEEGLVVLGKSCHAKDAPQGKNALTRLAMALVKEFDFAPLNLLGQVVQENATGKNLIGKFIDEQSGELTMNFASLEITPEQTKIGVDMRIPVTFTKEEIVEKLATKVQEFDLKYEEHDFLNSLYVPLDSELITNLLATYREMTGDLTEPMISGGATFARTMNNCVAFGAMFSDTPDYMHQANEQWELASMYQVMDIYAEAIYRLCAK